MIDRSTLLVVAAVAVAFPVVANAATAEESCQKGRYAAATKYAQCELKVVGSLFGGNSTLFPWRMSKCREKYTATWAKLQAKAAGTLSTCDQPRYTVGGGTVRDNLTGLEWEQTTDDSGIHDKDNVYTWSDLGDMNDEDADGTVFTTLLATLNGGACFAGHCDWRLPTRAELMTIVLEPYPCVTMPCIDQSVFGPTSAMPYFWTSTPFGSAPDNAWYVSFQLGDPFDGYKPFPDHVRAVRGGL